MIRSQGNNLSSDGTCNLTEPTDKRNIIPRLGPLQNNGGATDTRALLAGSAALDGGVTIGCPTVDQRGVARPQGLRCDIGAFERRNRKPVARDDSFRASEDTALRVAPRGVLRNDTDPDGDRLRASIANRPTRGQLTSGQRRVHLPAPARLQRHRQVPLPSQRRLRRPRHRHRHDQNRRPTEISRRTRTRQRSLTSPTALAPVTVRPLGRRAGAAARSRRFPSGEGSGS